VLQAIKNKLMNSVINATEVVAWHPRIRTKLNAQYNKRGQRERDLLRAELRTEIRNEMRELAREILQDENFRNEFIDVAQYVTEDQEFGKQLWRKTNVRPSDTDCHWAVIPNSIREARMWQATMEAADFVMQEIPHLEGHKTPFGVLEYCLSKVKVDGLYLEFGVYSGTTINHIAEQTSKTIHGFDSFEGLPEQWGTVPAGRFHTEGNLPDIRDNVKLHKGWFDDTLPEFIKSHPEPVAFIHADADLYSSTKTILWTLKDQIVPGTIIVFDEYINYPYWKEHEYKAFTEFCAKFNWQFEYLSYADRGYSVGVRMR